MQNKIVKTIIHSVKDSDIDMPNNSTQDTWDWFLEIVCDSSSGWGDLSDNVCSILEKINKHYEKVKNNLTHDNMRELLDMTSMRHCEWEVLSEHYIKVKK